MTMENQSVLKSNNAIVAEAYETLTSQLESFIAQRVSIWADVENLVQDIWVRALTYSQPLNADTLKSFMFTLARNIVNDYLRHMYIASGVHDDIRNGASLYADDVESAISASDLAAKELWRVNNLPPQRRRIYCMTRFEEFSVDEIAEQMNLSVRTVENHLRLGRRDVRAYIEAIA